MSCRSGTGFVWYQIPAPITTLFYSKPETDMHVTKKIIYDLFLFNLPLVTILAIIITATSANSVYTSLSATFIFGARNFHPIMHQLIVPRCRRITFGRRAFSVAGPTVWNSLPTEFRSLSVSFGDFRRTLKTTLFAQY